MLCKDKKFYFGQTFVKMPVFYAINKTAENLNDCLIKKLLQNLVHIGGVLF